MQLIKTLIDHCGIDFHDGNSLGGKIAGLPCRPDDHGNPVTMSAGSHRANQFQRGAPYAPHVLMHAPAVHCDVHELP
jgi:hypothetical protein